MKFPRTRQFAVLLLATSALTLSLLTVGETTPAQLPEFTHAGADSWINSEPLSTDDLQGKVVLLDIWTFSCWNCYRSFPWLRDVEQKFEGEDFTVLGVHSPEFSHERERSRIVAKTREFKLTHPIMIDNDFSYWNALGNRFWPTFYLVDRNGRIRNVYAGETHTGDRRATEIESTIRALLEE